MAETCETCRFWRIVQNIFSNVDGRRLYATGLCRRRAPVRDGPGQRFPSTQSDEWCGEYEAERTGDKHDGPSVLRKRDGSVVVTGLGGGGSYSLPGGPTLEPNT